VTAMQVFSCREIVELVTDYLEGDLDADTATASKLTSICAPVARGTWNRSAKPSPLSAKSARTTCPPTHRPACWRRSEHFADP